VPLSLQLLWPLIPESWCPCLLYCTTNISAPLLSDNLSAPVNGYLCASAYLRNFNTSYKYFRFPVYNRYFAPLCTNPDILYHCLLQIFCAPVYYRYFAPLCLLQIFSASVYNRYFAPLFTTDTLHSCLRQIFSPLFTTDIFAPVYYRYFEPLFTTDMFRPCLLQIFCASVYYRYFCAPVYYRYLCSPPAAMYQVRQAAPNYAARENLILEDLESR
jgi:hypothetical protein